MDQPNPASIFRNKWLLAILGPVILGAGVALVAREPILLAVGDLLVVRDTLRPADLIVVISAGPERDEYGLQLYQRGYGERIFITGGVCPIHGHDAKYAVERAAELGLPPDTIAFTDQEVTSTYSEAVKLGAFIKENRLAVRSVIVVTAPYHSWRTRWAFRHVLGGGVQVQMAPFEPSPSPRRWWTDAHSRRFVTREYGKIVYYLARYKYSPGPIRDWLASLDVG